jgi:hypothetical protein
VTSDGAKAAPAPRRGGGAAAPRQEQIELPEFRVSEIIVAGSGASLSTDLIEECCERGIPFSFLSSNGRPFGPAGADGAAGMKGSMCSPMRRGLKPGSDGHRAEGAEVVHLGEHLPTKVSP